MLTLYLSVGEIELIISVCTTTSVFAVDGNAFDCCGGVWNEDCTEKKDLLEIHTKKGFIFTNVSYFCLLQH